MTRRKLLFAMERDLGLPSIKKDPRRPLGSRIENRHLGIIHVFHNWADADQIMKSELYRSVVVEDGIRTW